MNFRQRIQKRIQAQKQEHSTFAVYKDARNALRWIARSTTAYRDRDGEILTIAALDADSQRMMQTKQFGPLRWWHVGQPDPANTTAPWGVGLDVGDCDFSMQIGTTRVESGTFRSSTIAERIAAQAQDFELSPGFFHSSDQPSADGVYHDIQTFERSLVPTALGARASNLFTGFSIKEQHVMDPKEAQRRLKAAIQLLGIPAEQAKGLENALQQTDKAAKEQSVAFKDTAKHEVYTTASGVQGIVVDGQFVELNSTAKAEEPEAETKDELEEAAELEAIDDAGMIEAIADAVAKKLAPALQALAQVATQKDASARTAIATLENTLKSVQQQLAELSGTQPAVTMSNDVAEALKSAGPQQATDPNAPQVPDDPNRPFASLAAATMPTLYGPGGWPK